MRYTLILLIGLIATLLTAAHATAAENPAKVELLADVSAVVPGATFNIAVKFTIEPGWHVYWINPGDAGLPTVVTFHAPDGFKVEPLGYPTPIQFDQPGNVVGYGYTESLVMMAKVTAPENMKPGTAVDLSVDAKWLVCKDVCIPGKAAVTLQLKVDVKSQAANEKLFKESQANLPAPASEKAVVTDAVHDQSDHTMTVRWKAPARNVRVFTAPGRAWTLEHLQIEQKEAETTVHFTARQLDKSVPAVEMPVVLAYDDDTNQRRSIQLVVPLGNEKISK